MSALEVTECNGLGYVKWRDADVKDSEALEFPDFLAIIDFDATGEILGVEIV